jgi:hypothetical protein
MYPEELFPCVMLLHLLGLNLQGVVLLGLYLPGVHGYFICHGLPLILYQLGYYRAFRSLMTGLACLGRGGRVLSVSDPPHDEMDGLVLEAEKLLA